MNANHRQRKPWQYSLRALLLTVAVIAMLCGAVSAYQQWRFPYGRSHCCDLALAMQLRQYALTHGGSFPTGEATAEASLSLLYGAGLAEPDLLRGKTVPESVVLQILSQGKLLTPETCGWHYVPGLTTEDNRRLALFWDKAGLGHNGERLSNGRYVTFVSGTKEFIRNENWTAFLEEQAQLMSARAGEFSTECP